jgi:16S rRNA (guanine1207-N2)-methyltransferase
VLRLPLDKGAFEMALHAIAARLPQGAPLLVYGPNDEGIKSAANGFSPFFENAETVSVKGHARIWRATRTEVMEGLRGTLADWRKVTPLLLKEQPRDWVSYPGVFAKGGLDGGTALLLRHLPDADGKSALDFGAGTGVIARVLADRGARVTLIERDAVALAAARENVPEAQAILGSALPEGRFDLIVSNPPVHAGKAKNLTVLAALIANARRHLRKGGALVIVVQQTVPVARLAEGHIGAQIRAEEGGYRIWALS